MRNSNRPVKPSRQRRKQRRNLRAALRQREGRYPIWSARAIMGVALIAVVITCALVLLIGKQRLLAELELTLGIVAGGLFLFLAVGLYRGARVKKHEPIAGELKFYDGTGLDNVDVIGEAAGAADDPLGWLLGLVAGILLSILLVFLLFVFINVAIVVFFLFLLALGWIFHRALRTVFARSKRCRGDLPASLGYAALYTMLYTGWLLALLLGVDWLEGR